MRKYYKYTYSSWTRPNLSTYTNGTFTVSANKETQYNSNPYKAWEAFDNSSSTFWRSGTTSGWIMFKNKNPLNVTSLTWGYLYNYPTSGTVEVSNNGVDFTEIKTWTNNSGADFTINLTNNTEYYNYYKVNINGVNTDVIHLCELGITATEKVVIEGTASDYDFYEDIDVYKTIVNIDKDYWKTLYEYTTPGTYSMDLVNGDYIIEIFGGGGGLAISGYNNWFHGGGGGSAAGFKGLVTLPSDTYTVTVGNGGIGRIGGANVQSADNGTSSIFSNPNSNLIVAGNGTGGWGSYDNSGGGTGGTLTLSDSLTIKKIYCKGNGYNGGTGGAYGTTTMTVYGGNSIQDGTVYGAGAGGSRFGSTGNGYGVDGYFRIYGKSNESNYDLLKENKQYNIFDSKEQVYHNYVHEYITTGNYEITLEEGDYEIEMYGAGAGACRNGHEKYWTKIGGGSGAGFKGIIHLSANTYTLTIGAGGAYADGNAASSGNGGNTTFADLITCGGGIGAYYAYHAHYDNRNGEGGTLTISDNANIVGTPELQSNGNDGQRNYYMNNDPATSGGLSLYDGTLLGYGAGGSSNVSNSSTKGIGGYLKIVDLDHGYYTTKHHLKMLKL